ncbi:MAG: DUF167 domain-containing protein [Patescibacteria group bacterium]
MLYIKAVVSAQMKKDSVMAKTADNFIITVKEKTERNMANKKVIELLASYFKVPKGKIRIINGHHHSHKLLVIDN